MDDPLNDTPNIFGSHFSICTARIESNGTLAFISKPKPCAALLVCLKKYCVVGFGTIEFL